MRGTNYERYKESTFSDFKREFPFTRSKNGNVKYRVKKIKDQK